MRRILVVLSLLVGGSSFAFAQTAGGSSGGSKASGTATTGSAGYAGSSLLTGHIISGTAESSAPNAGTAISHGATGGDVDASSVAPAPTTRDNAVDTPVANNAAKSLSNTNTGILKK